MSNLQVPNLIGTLRQMQSKKKQGLSKLVERMKRESIADNLKQWEDRSPEGLKAFAEKYAPDEEDFRHVVKEYSGLTPQQFSKLPELLGRSITLDEAAGVFTSPDWTGGTDRFGESAYGRNNGAYLYNYMKNRLLKKNQPY